LLIDDLQVHRSSVANFIINVVQASAKRNNLNSRSRYCERSGNSPPQQNIDALGDSWISNRHAELGETGDGSSADDGVLQYDSVVNVSDEFGWLLGLGTLDTEQVQDANREFCEFAVLDEFAEMGEGWKIPV
jgi:hypothetical protein